MSRLRRDLLALAVVALGITLFHARGLRPGYTFLAVDLATNNLPWRPASPAPVRNNLISDPLFEFYPFVAHGVETVRQGGGWPRWNSRILLGHPTIADTLAQPLYPVFLALGLVFGPARGLALGYWLHALWAGTCTYGLLRTTGCARPGAVLGAFTYALSGYMVSWFEFTYWLGTLSWFPAILWAFELAVRRRSWRFVAAAALAMAAAMLAGHLQLVVNFTLFFGLYAAGRALEAARAPAAHASAFAGQRAVRLRAAGWPLVALAATAALGALLSAVQTVPFAEVLGLSLRPGAQSLTDALPLPQLVTLIVPSFYGNPATTGEYWGAMNFLEGTIYAGLPGLLLACLAPLCVRRTFTRYLALVALLAVVFIGGGPGVRLLDAVPVVKYGSLHRATFLLPLIVAVLAATTIGAPRAPAGAAAIVALAMAMVVGLALTSTWGRAQGHWPDLQRPVLGAAALLLATVALLALRGRVAGARRYADGGLVLLVFLDLCWAGSRFNPAGPIARLMPPTPGIEYLRRHAGLHRVAALQLADVTLLGPNVLSTYGIAEAGGYSSVVPARLQQLVDAGDPKDEAPGIGYWLKQNRNIVFFSRPSSRLLDLLQVAFVVAPGPVDGPPLAALGPEWREAYRGEMYILERRPPPHRASVVYAAEHIPDEARAARRLLDPSFDLPNVAVAAGPLPLPARAAAPASPAEIVSYRDTQVVVRATAAQPGLLVLGDQFYPGWQAHVDGQPAPVLRVNHVLRGVLLPEGEHDVVFQFAPASLLTGAGLSLVGVAILALMVALDRYPRTPGHARPARRRAGDASPPVPPVEAGYGPGLAVKITQ